MNISIHPALIAGSYCPAAVKRLRRTHQLLPFLVDQSIRLNNVTPSLHPHYRTSSLLRVIPSLCSASVLSLLRVLHLSFSLTIWTTGSHVPHKSLAQVHATFMPDAAQAVLPVSVDGFVRRGHKLFKSCVRKPITVLPPNIIFMLFHFFVKLGLYRFGDVVSC